MSRISTRLWIPVIGSFAVYLVPLVGPHAIWLVGESLAQGGGCDGPNLVAGRECGLRVCTDGGRVCCRWTTRGSRLRLLTWVLMVPALVAGMNVAYLVKIPSYFLIEPDTAPERQIGRSTVSSPMPR